MQQICQFYTDNSAFVPGAHRNQLRNRNLLKMTARVLRSRISAIISYCGNVLRHGVLIEKKIAKKIDRNRTRTTNLDLTLTECNINTNLGGRDDYVDRRY